MKLGLQLIELQSLIIKSILLIKLCWMLARGQEFFLFLQPKQELKRYMRLKVAIWQIVQEDLFMEITYKIL